MAKAKRYSMEQIRGVQKTLRGMAAKKVGRTKAEAVEFLAGDIRRLLGKGYSLEDIRDTLTQAGIPASVSRMKAILEGGVQESEGVSEANVAPAVVRSGGSETKKDTAPAKVAVDNGM